MTISLGRRSPRRLKRPTRGSSGSGRSAGKEKGREAHSRTNAPLFGLAPGGVCLARPVTRPAGELLPHRFNPYRTDRSARRFVFCGTFPTRPKPSGGRYPPPRPVESGLSSEIRFGPALRPIRPVSRRSSRLSRPYLHLTAGCPFLNLFLLSSGPLFVTPFASLFLTFPEKPGRNPLSFKPGVA